MNHIQEYKKYGTVNGWSEAEAKNHENPFIRLELKDAKGLASIEEKVAIEINSLLGYHNIDYVASSEVFDSAKRIMKITKKKANGK